MLARSASFVGVLGIGGFLWLGCGEDAPAVPGEAADAGATANDGGPASVTPEAGSGSDSSPVDGASTAVDAAPPPTVPVKYGSCAAFAKCGGAVAGSYKVSGGCVSDEAFKALKNRCPGLQESDVVITARGTLEIGATSIKRNTTTDISAKLLVPKSCPPLPALTCAQISAALKSGFGGPKFDTANCVESGTNCNCAVTSSIVDESADTYTTTPDGTLTTVTEDRTFEYCVAGNKTTFKETTGSNPLALIVEVTK